MASFLRFVLGRTSWTSFSIGRLFSMWTTLRVMAHNLISNPNNPSKPVIFYNLTGCSRRATSFLSGNQKWLSYIHLDTHPRALLIMFPTLGWHFAETRSLIHLSVFLINQLYISILTTINNALCMVIICRCRHCACWFSRRLGADTVSECQKTVKPPRVYGV